MIPEKLAEGRMEAVPTVRSGPGDPLCDPEGCLDFAFAIDPTF